MYTYFDDVEVNDLASRKVFARGCSLNSCVETNNVTCCYKDLCNITNNTTKKFKNNLIFYLYCFINFNSTVFICSYKFNNKK